jgi:AraC-like DNA-binding protein
MTVAPQDMTDQLRAALAQLRLAGAIFFRSEFTESWAYESPPAEEIARMLHPGSKRLIMFHIVARGRCWVEVDGVDRHWADEGDMVVIPYGDQHRVGGEDDATLVPISELFAPPPWESLPVLRHGAGGERCDIVCGYLHSDDVLFEPALQAFPPLFVVTPPAGPVADWVRSSIQFALDASAGRPPSDPLMARLPEVLLAEVLQLHLATAGADRGWIAALRDPVLAPAMAAIHGAPEEHWTVSDLAAKAHVSRSVLDERFREVIGRAPIRYLTDWRMHLAGDLLRSTDLGIAAVATRVGYDSEEAFSRAFKRHHGAAPGSWRSSRD